jgi:hypothetical protein
MQTDRRSVLKASGIAAALGATGLAGCSGFLGGGGEPGPADYRYDPSELTDTENKFYGIVDYAGLYEARENFPESTRESLESSEESPVDPADIDTLTGVGGAQVSMGEQSASSTVFGSLVLLGSFDQSTVEQDLQENGAQETGEYEGYTLYENAGGSSPSSAGSMGNASTTAAVRNGAAVFGAVGSQDETNADITGEQAARVMIDASNGNVGRLEENSERVQSLNSRLGETNMTMGGQIDPALVETAMQQSQGGGMQTQFIEGIRAGGFGMTVEGETTTMNAVFLYTDADRAENSGVKELVDLASQQAVEENPGLDSVEAEYDGNAAVVTVEGATETVFEQGTSAGPGGGFAVSDPADVGAAPVLDQ